jgi:hypothetical protein
MTTPFVVLDVPARRSLALRPDIPMSRSARHDRRGGGRGEDPSSPGLLANTIASATVVQVGDRCPAVKRECPVPRRSAGHGDDAHSCLTAATGHGQPAGRGAPAEPSHGRRNRPHNWRHMESGQAASSQVGIAVGLRSMVRMVSKRRPAGDAWATHSRSSGIPTSPAVRVSTSQSARRVLWHRPVRRLKAP